ncbi:MAG: hypothetical protein JWP47_1399 [Polaromonas sp.]|jgi:hypothetical protein|nr:hypothetical protein [Polaromonas sp.]
MRMHFLKLMPAGILAAALLAGCGGGGSSSPVAAADPGASGGGSAALTPAPDLSQSAAALYSYLVSLIAGSSDSTLPVDINGTALAVDDRGDASPVN